MSDVSRETPGEAGHIGPPPPVACEVFGERLALAERYGQLLATAGVERGLIGPREAPRLWERHLVNCALIAQAVPAGVHVGDVGSGAGLPGIPLAIARPDLTVTLIEPLLRRTTFLDEVVADLGLAHVSVRRGRAEEFVGEVSFDVVTSRAVAPLGRLLRWSMPLVAVDGALLAMKGSSLEQEIVDAKKDLRQLRCGDPEILEISSQEGHDTVRLVRVTRGAAKATQV